MAKVTMTDVVDGVAVDTSSVTVTVSQGASGTDGTDGLSVLNGSGAPSSSLGVDGDFYIDTTAHAIYGPKASGAWGSSTSLIGPAGADGTNGTDGADGEGVPVGGTTGQVLAKTSDTDFDTEWVDQTSGTGSVSSDDITDATTVGKAVLTATDAATARTAIGAGTSSLAIGTTSTTALAGNTAIPSTPADIGAATAAQGALADSATQPGDLATVATTGAYSDLTGTPTIPDSPDDIGAVPTTRTVAGHALSADVTISAADVSAAPTTRTVTAGTGLTGGGDLSADRTLSVDTTAEAERIRDVIGTALVAGTNVTITVDDAGDTITIAASGTGGGGSTTSYSDIFLLMGA